MRSPSDNASISIHLGREMLLSILKELLKRLSGCVQVGMNMSANEEPQRQHYGFYTFGLFTSRRRALACIQARGMSVGVLTILPVSINEPLKPCLSSDILTSHETRQMVSPAHR